ncbi:MAG TPA: glycosyltransferase family 2 protein [Dissulfurispiraceae bacterium]
MDIRRRILAVLYQLFPFSLQGDLRMESSEIIYDVSCVINFYGRIDLLRGILYSLAGQDMPKKRFEVILVEDRGGTEEGKSIYEEFRRMLSVKYFPLDENHGKMGFSRNFGLSRAKGKYILFLDDDTVILQNNFLSEMVREFEEKGCDALIPGGSASYSVVKGKYGYHEPFFPTNRCMAYRREVLAELGGFVSGIIGQEDVEFVIRYTAAGKKFSASERLHYLHPPLIVGNLGKPAAVGLSFSKLRPRYPFVLWFMVLCNGLRYLPLLLVPIKLKWRMQGRFSAGFLLGIIHSLTGRRALYK